MCTMNTLKMGVMTTVGAAALTAGAIAGAVIVGGMGIAAASTALIVASVALGVFTLWAGVTVGLGLHFDRFKNNNTTACDFFRFMPSTLVFLKEKIGDTFKKCCCCL